jgi:hypothetical protein
MYPLKAAALERDKYCQRVKDGRVCGCTERLTLHHQVPKRQGGIEELTNVVIWCWDCHRNYNIQEMARKRHYHDLKKECKWTIDWRCKPDYKRCGTCTAACANWPDGFVEALCRLLLGEWPTGSS